MEAHQWPGGRYSSLITGGRNHAQFCRFVGICRGIQIQPVRIVQVLTKQAALLTAEHTAGLQANILLLMKNASYVYFVRAEIIKIMFCTLNQIKILANAKFDCFVLVSANIKRELHINQVSRDIYLTQAYHVFSKVLRCYETVKKKKHTVLRTFLQRKQGVWEIMCSFEEKQIHLFTNILAFPFLRDFNEHEKQGKVNPMRAQRSLPELFLWVGQYVFTGFKTELKWLDIACVSHMLRGSVFVWNLCFTVPRIKRCNRFLHRNILFKRAACGFGEQIQTLEFLYVTSYMCRDTVHVSIYTKEGGTQE